MNKTLNVFILAAGLGERLQPITRYIPKPLLPILGKPLLQSILERVLTLPVNRIGINLYYKREIIEDWIRHSPFYEKIIIFPEDIPLGTGGILKKAESFLKKGIFLVHNSDIFSDIDLTELLKIHLSSKNLATLAVYDFHEINNLLIDKKEGLFRGIAQKEKARGIKKLTFTGIAVYSPEFLQFIPTGVSSIVDAWLKALAMGQRIGIVDVSGYSWHDIGTPSAYSFTLFNTLRADGEMMYIHPSVKSCKYVNLDGYIVIERGSILEEGSSLRNCIVLPGGYAKRNIPYENCIIGPDFKIEIEESKLPGLKDSNALLISTGGSDRRYYRIKKGKNSVILMQWINRGADFQRQIEYTRFFLRYSIPVPKLIKIDSDNKKVLFEDLGDLSLYNWLKCPRDGEEIEEMYKKIIDVIILLHTIPIEHVSECPLLHKAVFDYNHLRWETEYFIERFVEGVKNIKVKNPSALNEEFHRLALRVESFPRVIIHRDFQSQNILIKKGTPYLIDYQGARIGPPAYDVVSLLWDPYYRIEDKLRKRLLNYYITRMINTLGKRFNDEEFRETLLPCRLQRHMQALGAYGFLSMIKGKGYFLKHIPEGLRLLKEDVRLSKNEYPELYNLVMKL